MRRAHLVEIRGGDPRQVRILHHCASVRGGNAASIVEVERHRYLKKRRVSKARLGLNISGVLSPRARRIHTVRHIEPKFIEPQARTEL